MKNVIISIVAIVSFAALSCGQAENTNAVNAKNPQEQKSSTFKNVSVSDLNWAMSTSDEFTILDVRTPGELSQGYVEKAVNMDVNNSNFRSEAASLDKDKTVYVYCRSGIRSQNASKILIELGFSDVRNVEGGFTAWLQKGYKIVK